MPDPIIANKNDLATSLGKDPLLEVSVPSMIYKLKQGVGRLIRNFSDKGIVSILDPRLKRSSGTKYQQIVWDALPIKNQTTSLNELKNFYDLIYPLN